MLTQNLPALVVRPNAVPLPAIQVGRPPSTFLAGHPALVATDRPTAPRRKFTAKASRPNTSIKSFAARFEPTSF